MFERYTEKARRVIFFARYEASQFGSPVIDTEHLLLGILRESKDLLESLSRVDSAKQIKEEIRLHFVTREKISTSVDLPFSEDAKRALILGSEEADQAGDRVIETEHILIGLLRKDGCLAQKILSEMAVTPESVRNYQRRGENAAADIVPKR
jgi:ATP-dependent Clp protease ATP-binding subunit ClpC